MSKRSVRIVLNVQCKSGKNGVKTTRSGVRYPTPAFKTWRQFCLEAVEQQGHSGAKLDGELNCVINYTPGDLIRRDVPGMMDAIFHVLERAEVVLDDAKISNEVKWFRHPLDRKNPKVEIFLQEAA